MGTPCAVFDARSASRPVDHLRPIDRSEFSWCFTREPMRGRVLTPGLCQRPPRGVGTFSSFSLCAIAATLRPVWWRLPIRATTSSLISRGRRAEPPGLSSRRARPVFAGRSARRSNCANVASTDAIISPPGVEVSTPRSRACPGGWAGPPVAVVRCPGCGRSLPVDAFSPDASRWWSGRKAICRACDRAKSRAYYAANRERVIERVRAYQTAKTIRSSRTVT